MTRAELQATLKQLRIDGYNVQIKLTAKTELLLTEYNRLTSQVVTQEVLYTAEVTKDHLKVSLETITADDFNAWVGLPTEQVEMIASECSEVYSVKQPLKTIEDAQGEDFKTLAEVLVTNTTNRYPKKLEALQTKVLQIQPGSYGVISLCTPKQPSGMLEGIPSKTLSPLLVELKQNDVLVIASDDISRTIAAAKQPLEQLEDLSDKHLDQQPQEMIEQTISDLRFGSTTSSEANISRTLGATKQPFKTPESLPDINLEGQLNQNENIEHISQTDSYPATDISVYVSDDYDPAKQPLEQPEGLPDKDLSIQLNPNETIERVSQTHSFPEEIPFESPEVYSVKTKAGCNLVATNSGSGLIEGLPDKDLRVQLSVNLGTTNVPLEQPEVLPSEDPRVQPDKTKAGYWIDGSELGAVMEPTTKQALRNLEDAGGWLRRAGSNLKAFAEGFRGGWKEAEGRRQRARLLRSEQSPCTNSSLTVPKERLSKAIPLANHRPLAA